MTREYAPTRPVRRGRLTRRGWAVLYVLGCTAGLLAGMTAELWNPYAQVTP